MNMITVTAEVCRWEPVRMFLEDCMQTEYIPDDVRFKVCLAAEEVFVNIADHAYPDDDGTAEIGCAVEEVNGVRQIHLIFRDGGIPFDPLEQNAPAEDILRDDNMVGGFGIFLVQKLMDRVEYCREAECNILELICNAGSRKGGDTE